MGGLSPRPDHPGPVEVEVDLEEGDPAPAACACTPTATCQECRDRAAEIWRATRARVGTSISRWASAVATPGPGRRRR